MTKRIWNERKWWHGSVLILVGAIGIGCLVAGMVLRAEQLPEKTIFVFDLLLPGFILTVGALIVGASERSMSAFRATAYKALVLIEKKTGRVVKAEIQEVYLNYWPWSSGFSVKQYPTSFNFSTRLNPITTNPKVIPLYLSLTVTLADHESLPDWFITFLGDWKSGRNKFFAETFELLQHRLPQEISNDLNPFDSSTVKRLKEYLGREFEVSLPFRHNIEDLTVSMAA